jgi:hypothetical protein
MKQADKTGRSRVAKRGERSEYAPGRRPVGGQNPMKNDGDDARTSGQGGNAGDLDLVAKRLRDIQRGKRGDVRWGMSRQTAERAIEAIRPEEDRPPYQRSAKSRRRKRSKRLL